jgi:hypothetical protein
LSKTSRALARSIGLITGQDSAAFSAELLSRIGRFSTACLLKLQVTEPPDVNGMRYNRQAGAGIAASRPLQVDVQDGSTFFPLTPTP